MDTGLGDTVLCYPGILRDFHSSRCTSAPLQEREDACSSGGCLKRKVVGGLHLEPAEKPPEVLAPVDTLRETEQQEEEHSLQQALELDLNIDHEKVGLR